MKTDMVTASGRLCLSPDTLLPKILYPSHPSLTSTNTVYYIVVTYNAVTQWGVGTVLIIMA